MSLNFERIGKPIAMIINKDDKQILKTNPIVCINEDSEEARTSYNDIKLNRKEQIFQVINDQTQERFIYYIIGRSGSGKSYFIKKWIQNFYHELYKKRPVYVFSYLDSDKTLDELKYLKRIKLDEEFLDDDEISIKDFANSCVIMDDIDNIKNKAIKRKVDNLLNEILTVGRHHNVSALITRHTATNGQDTKIILAESHSYVIFPSGVGNRPLKYLLDNYLGLDSKQIKKIKNSKSRYVCIQRTFPLSVVSEKECYLLNNDD
jgi:3-methyladenine DNA glycosylase AlkC